jgi:hypothetical protein
LVSVYAMANDLYRLNTQFLKIILIRLSIIDINFIRQKLGVKALMSISQLIQIEKSQYFVKVKY